MEPKQRHGVLAAMIVLGIFVNFPMGFNIIYKYLSFGFENPIPFFQLLLILFQIVFFIALYNWKKWGLYGLILTSLGYFVLGIYMRHVILSPLLGLIVFNVILWGILLLKKGNNSGLANLE